MLSLLIEHEHIPLSAPRPFNEFVVAKLDMESMEKMIQVRQLRYLTRVAKRDQNRLPRRMIGARAVKPAGCKGLKENHKTLQGTYKKTLEDAGLTTKKKGGDFSEWMPKLRDPKAISETESPLNLRPGTLGTRNGKSRKH